MAGAKGYSLIYRNGKYITSCKYFEDAAAIAGLTKGTVVKWEGRKVIWTEGAEATAASESWDEAAATMRLRVNELRTTTRKGEQ